MTVVFIALAMLGFLGLVVVALSRARLGGETWKDFLVAATYFPLAVGFFWQILLEEGAHLSRGYGNLASQSFPVLSFAAASAEQGRLPLWNPYLYGGHPIFADAGAALFYPLNVVAVIASTPFTYGTVQQLVLVHVILLAIFTFACARFLSLGRTGAFAAGAIFAFGGYTAAHLDSLNTVEGLTWLPLTLLLLHLGIERRSITLSALSGGAFGMSILAGNLQLVTYTGAVVVAYWAWIALRRPGRGTEESARGFNLARLIALPVCLMAAFGIAAVQILPTFQLMGLSLNREATLGLVAGRTAGAEQLVSLLVPYFFGENLGGSWVLPPMASEAYGYVGILPLFLAGIGVLAWSRRRAWVSFLAVVAIVSLVVSALEPILVGRYLVRFLPWFAKSGSVAHATVLFDLAVALLAAAGLDSVSGAMLASVRRARRVSLPAMAAGLIGLSSLGGAYSYYSLIDVRSQSIGQVQRTSSATDSVVLALLFLALGFASFWLFRYHGTTRRAVPIALLVFSIADLFGANSSLNVSRQDLFAKTNHPDIDGFLKSELRGSRIDTMTGVADVWEQNSALLSGHPDAVGPPNPLMLDDYYRFWENLGSRSAAAYDLLGARYVLASGSTVLEPPKFRPLPSVGGSVRVYENLSVLPRAMVVPSAEVTPRGEMLSRLRSPSFNPRETLLLEQGAVPAIDAGSGKGAGEVSRLDLPSANEVRAIVNSTSAAFLLLNDAYYPGWKAYVDGKEASVLRANYAFRAVSVPEGEHQVRMVFEPAAFRIGAGATALAASALLLLGFGTLLSSLRKPSVPEPSVGAIR